MRSGAAPGLTAAAVSAPRGVHTLELAGFRSHRHTRLDCGGASVVLCGANGAGKTSLLEAASMFSPGQGLRSGSAEQAIRAPGGAGWRVRAEIGSPPTVVEAELSSNTGMRRRVLLDGAATPRSRLVGALRIAWMTPALSRVWSESAGGRRRMVDRTAAALYADHAPASARYQKCMRERSQLLRDGPADGDWLEALEAGMGECGETISRNRTNAMTLLREAVEEGGEMFRGARFAIVGGDGKDPSSAAIREADGGEDHVWTEDRLRAALRGGRARDAASGRTLSGPHRDDLAAWLAETGIAAASASTGEQKGLLAAYCIAASRALARDGTPVLLLLDEVLAHLDEARREAFLGEVEGAGAQVWMTGTDPDLFRALEGRARRFELTLADGESRLVPLP